jgi:hypothetical protein
VDDAGVVDRFEPHGDLDRGLVRIVRRQPGFAVDQLLEVRSVHVLHADVPDAQVLAVLVDPAHVAVGNLAGELDLGMEAAGRLLRPAELRAQDLEGHVLLEGAVVGLVDNAHPPAPEQAQDLEAVGDHFARRQRQQGATAGQATLGVVAIAGSARTADHHPPCFRSLVGGGIGPRERLSIRGK